MGYNFPGISKKKNPRIVTKYGRQQCNGGCRPGGRWHGSREESIYCNQLSLEQKGGAFKSYKSQVRYDLWRKDNENPAGYLLVDFEIILNNGNTQIREYKGKGLERFPEFVRGRALLTHCYPDIEYVTVGKNQIVI